MQSEWLNSALSPVVYGDIVLNIKINTQNTHQYTKYTNLFLNFTQLYNFTCRSLLIGQCRRAILRFYNIPLTRLWVQQIAIVTKE